MIRVALSLQVLTALLILGSPLVASQAQAAGDFNATSDDWNGLSYLVATAQEAHVELRLLPELDFGALRPKEVLFVLAPQVGLSEDNRETLLRFVSQGGKLIVADDFRAGKNWMRALGLTLLPRAGPADAHDGGRAALPMMQVIEEPELAHNPPPTNRFLGFEVDKVVLNHPASLISMRSPPPGTRLQIRGPYLHGFQSWLVEVMRNKGRALAIADSSIFINAMLQRHRGNKQFAANVLRYYCLNDRPCEVAMVVGVQQIFGSLAPRPPRAGGHLLGTNDPRPALREALSTLTSLLQSKSIRPLMWLIFLLALAAPILWISRLPAPLLPPHLDTGRRGSLLAETVEAWLESPEADYRRPARQLALHLSRLVAQVEKRHAEAQGERPRSRGKLGISALPDRIEDLVQRGQLSEQAGGKVCEIVLALHDAAGEKDSEMNRARFTQLAAEIEWAEHVLSHTVRAE